MAADPAALQLRLLQTVIEVAAEKNSTLVMPVPVELLRFFDRAAPATADAQPPAADAQDTGASPPPVPEIPALPVPASAALTAPLNAAPQNTSRCLTGATSVSQPQREQATACVSMHPSGTFDSSSPVPSAICSPTAAISIGLRRDRRALSYAAGATLPRRAR
jgi:hypothetical protein